MLAKDLRQLNPTYRATSSTKVRQVWAEQLGTTCRICGATPIEYHHLIPIKDGGTNECGNVVPLCLDCHYKVHNKKRNTAMNRQGRKRVEPKADVDKVMKEYLDGKHKMLDAMDILGFKRNKFNMELRAYKERTGDNREHAQIHDGIRYDMAMYR